MIARWAGDDRRASRCREECGVFRDGFRREASARYFGRRCKLLVATLKRQQATMRRIAGFELGERLIEGVTKLQVRLHAKTDGRKPIGFELPVRDWQRAAERTWAFLSVTRQALPTSESVERSGCVYYARRADLVRGLRQPRAMRIAEYPVLHLFPSVDLPRRLKTPRLGFGRLRVMDVDCASAMC